MLKFFHYRSISSVISYCNSGPAEIYGCWKHINSIGTFFKASTYCLPVSILSIHLRNQCAFSAEIIYVLGVSLLKLSILLLYLRIFNFRTQAYILTGLSACRCIVFIIALFASCQPFGYFFDRWNSEYNGACIDINAQISASSIINIILDGVITLLPTTQV